MTWDALRKACLEVSTFIIIIALIGCGCGHKKSDKVMIEFHLAEMKPAHGLFEKKLQSTGERFYLHPEVLLSNGDIVSTSVTLWKNYPVVELSFTETGGKKLASLTQAHIYKHIGMLVDGTLVSAPTIQGPILDGKAIINGNFSLDEAQRIADGITAGRQTKMKRPKFRLHDAKQLMSSYMQALRTGDKEQIYAYWSKKSLKREGFDYMHLWIGACIPITQWIDFFHENVCTYDIKNIGSKDNYHITDFEWTIKQHEYKATEPEVHPMIYYVIWEDDKWALINPIDILTENWLSYETEYFTFHYAPCIDIEHFLPELMFMDREYKKITGFLDIEFDGKIHYYKARNPKECGELVCFPPANGYCARGLPFRPNAPRWFHVVISTSFINLHEVIHLLAPLAGLYSINDAFDEGIAVALGGTTFHTPEVSSVQTRHALHKSEYVPLQMLLTNKEAFWRSSHVTYLQAGSFFRFLLNQYGLEPLRKLCNEPMVTEDLVNTVRSVYGFTISELEEQWHAYLLQTDIPELGYFIPKDVEVVFSMNDPQGDDDGDGNYSYPEDDRFGKGAFDLRAFEILKDEKNVYFRLKLQNITGAVTYDYIEERFAPGVVIAIFQSADEGKYGQSYFDCIQLDNSRGYHVKLCVGFGLAVSNNYGKIIYSKKDAFDTISKVRQNVLEFSLPIGFIGEPDTGWEYFVGVGLMGDRTMHFTGGPMPVYKKHRLFISGGNSDFGNPAFIDILLPESMNQSKLLGDCDATTGKPATIPMVKHN